MPKVSRNQLNVQVYAKLFTLLPALLSACSTPAKAQGFANALFSSSEKTMIAKRIAIILMLIKGRTYQQISTKLKVSQSTIGKMAEVVAGADQVFLAEFRKIARSDTASDFWNALGYKLDTFLPPKGANWSVWRSRKLKEKFANEQPF